MEAYQQRVVDERRELDEKIERLAGFIASTAFDFVDHELRQLLLRQIEAMGVYSEILRKRISLFEGAS